MVDAVVAGGPVIASPSALLVVVAMAIVYAMGRDRWSRCAGRSMVGVGPTATFFAGLAVVAVALASPLDVAADRSLTAHMVQHVLLLAVAGPLLGLGMPLPTLLWALPAQWRRGATVVTRRLTHVHDRHFVAWVTVALIAEALVMWTWHIPFLYQAAIRDAALHAGEHASFLLVASVVVVGCLGSS